MNSVRVLVTGANGFIGSYVCKELIRNGHEVVGLARTSKNRNGLAACYYVDIASEVEIRALAKQLGKIEAIIHCAAYLSYQDFDSRIMMVNAAGTQNVVTLAKQMGCKKLIYFSSAPVIGVPQIHPITEEHPLEPKTMYHVSKLAGEYIVRASGLSVVILRVPSPVGIGMNPRTILPTFVSCCMLGEDMILHGKGTRKQNYIGVQDIARAVALALSRDESVCYNLSGHLISNQKLALLCRETTGSSAKIVFSGQPDSADEQIWDISGQKIFQELGFVPQVSLKDSILELANMQKGAAE